jgi:hypothetical protein
VLNFKQGYKILYPLKVDIKYHFKGTEVMRNGLLLRGHPGAGLSKN